MAFRKGVVTLFGIKKHANGMMPKAAVFSCNRFIFKDIVTVLKLTCPSLEDSQKMYAFYVEYIINK